MANSKSIYIKSGTVTIKNSGTIKAAYKNPASDLYDKKMLKVGGKGKLIIKGGTYIGNVENYGTVNISNGKFKKICFFIKGGNTTISGGTFQNDGTIFRNPKGNLTIQKGTFLVNASYFDLSAVIQGSKGGNIVIKGGTFKNEEGNIFGGVFFSEELSNLNIIGGTFYAEKNYVLNWAGEEKLDPDYDVSDDEYPVYIRSKNKVKITGGTFNGKVNVYTLTNCTISGGQFNGNVELQSIDNGIISGGQFNGAENWIDSNVKIIGSNLKR